MQTVREKIICFVQLIDCHCREYRARITKHGALGSTVRLDLRPPLIASSLMDVQNLTLGVIEAEAYPKANRR